MAGSARIGAAFVALPLLTGAVEETRAKQAWLTLLGLLAAVYVLTDREAAPDS